MAKVAAKGSALYVAGYDFSGSANRLNPTLSEGLEDVTCFQDGGRKSLPTLREDAIALEGFYEPETGGIDEILESLKGTTGILCALMGGTAQNSIAYCGGAMLEESYKVESRAGGVVTLNAAFKADEYLDRCKVLEAKGAKTTDGNGSSIDEGPIVHKANDTTNVVSSANASDQATLETLLNEIKTDYNAHRVSTTFHEVADSTNVVSSANASDLPTALTLVNEIKADFNAHRVMGTVHYYTDPNAVTSADATNLATAITLANEIKTDYNNHRTATQSSLGGVGYVQVFGVSESDSVVVTIQDSPDNSNWSDLITFTSKSAIGAERKIVSLPDTVDRYIRAEWDVTGSSVSITIAVFWKRY